MLDKKALAWALAALLVLAFPFGCSTLTSVATDAVLGSATKGMEATAQVGKSNSKGLVAATTDISNDTTFDEVAGNALVDSGNTVTNDAKTMIGMVLAGMFLPMLLVFYLMPTPRWIRRRHSEKV